jgi:Pentapeptide repeats (8 copies)
MTQDRRVGRVAVRVPKWARWVLAVTLAAAVVVWLILVAPRLLVPATSPADLRDVPDAAKWQARDSRIRLQNDARTTLLQGLGGLAVLLAAFYTYQQVQTGRRQLHLAQQGQVTERFTRAIDQLGSDHLDVRLGGIYALERIARDSTDDRATIGEVLTAYIRGHAPWPPRLDGQPPAEAAIEDVPELQVRAPDVQASLTVLGRGGFAEQPRGIPGDELDLNRVDLRKAHLLHANLERATLSGANLAGALLFNVKLARAALTGVNLAEAQIVACDLARAKLGYTNLEKTYLVADLSGANLYGANLSGARLGRADLEGARLWEAVADGDTKWPPGFDWVKARVKLNGALPDDFKWR